MSLDAVKKALQSAKKDTFPIATVFKWMMGSRYTYAAIKGTDGQWYATSYNDTGWVPRRMDFDQLLEVLGNSSATGIAVATEWEYLFGGSDPYAEITPDGIKLPEETITENGIIYTLENVADDSHYGWFPTFNAASKHAKELFGVKSSKRFWNLMDEDEWSSFDDSDYLIKRLRRGGDEE